MVYDEAVFAAHDNMVDRPRAAAEQAGRRAGQRERPRSGKVQGRASVSESFFSLSPRGSFHESSKRRFRIHIKITRSLTCNFWTATVSMT